MLKTCAPAPVGLFAGISVGVAQKTGSRPRKQILRPSRAAASSSHDDASHPSKRAFEEYRNTEDHPSYRREDMSTEHAIEARLAFLEAVTSGEGTIDLTEAALQVSAEDDAMVSHSAVQFPVDAFRQRLRRLADEVARVVLPPLRAAGAPDDVVLSHILDFLYKTQGFGPPSFGRSNLPVGAVVDHPGVWENPRLAYLNDVLVTKRGLPATLAIILSDVLKRLLVAGAIDFAAKIECADLNRPPSATIIPGLSRSSVLMPMHVESTSQSQFSNAVMINMCSSDALVECLQYLKRAYWPWPWDASAGPSGGFRSAAKAFLDGAESAEAEAIARTAAHRLARGIWTSPGAGDVRRSIAAAERLLILRAGLSENAYPSEDRRDLGVLYAHAGLWAEAHAELKAWASARKASSNLKAPARITITDVGISSWMDGKDVLEDVILVDRLLVVIGQSASSSPGGDEAHMLDGKEAHRRCREIIRRDKANPRLLPLTWLLRHTGITEAAFSTILNIQVAQRGIRADEMSPGLPQPAHTWAPSDGLTPIQSSEALSSDLTAPKDMAEDVFTETLMRIRSTPCASTALPQPPLRVQPSIAASHLGVEHHTLAALESIPAIGSAPKTEPGDHHEVKPEQGQCNGTRRSFCDNDGGSTATQTATGSVGEASSIDAATPAAAELLLSLCNSAPRPCTDVGASDGERVEASVLDGTDAPGRRRRATKNGGHSHAKVAGNSRLSGQSQYPGPGATQRAGTSTTNNGGRESTHANGRQKTCAYVGVRRRQWGTYAAEIRNQLSGSREWLGTFDSAEEAAVVYDMRLRQIKGPGAKCNFPPLDVSGPLVKREICPHGKSAPHRLTMLIPKDWLQQVVALQSGTTRNELKRRGAIHDDAHLETAKTDPDGVDTRHVVAEHAM